MKKSTSNHRETRLSPSIKRRDFFKLLGSGIIVYFGTRNPSDLLAMPLAQRREPPTDYNAFIRIDSDGTVHCHVGKIEMGQGIITSLPQQIADELDVTLESVNMVMGDTLLCPYDAGTWGSLTTRQFSHLLRAAGAEARAVLLQLGAEYLGVGYDEVDVKNGKVFLIADPEKEVSYGALAKGQRIERFVEDPPPVKGPDEFHYVGQSRFHADAEIKVTGKAQYTWDLRLPGMVYAKIVRPPSHQSRLISADTSGAEAIEGVEIVREGGLVAVLHESYDTASVAIVKVKAEFTEDTGEVDHDSIFEYLLNSPSDSNERARTGDLETGEEISDVIFESEFQDGYKAHAPIEPHAALARWEEDGSVTVWASTQTPFGSQDEIANAFDLELEQVRVISPFLGGGFGGKIYNPQILEAVKIARLARKPVMVAYTREEEFFMDYLRPAAVVKLRSGMDTSGKLKLWDYNVYFAGLRGSDTIYNVPHSRTTGYDVPRGETVHLFKTGAWRAPANNTNTFARESQVDIMAHKAGVDPLQFRLDNLTDEKMIAVWKAVADKFGYTPAPAPSGRGIGMACGTDAGTWIATILEVEVDQETGHVKPIRMACAQDMGMCVNPQGSIIEIEGGLTMGLGYALAEDIEFKSSRMITLNFDSYQLPLFSWVPEIESVILDRMDEPPQGGGEPSVIVSGGAVANAIFDACGARVYRMPITPERILEALAGSAG